MRQLPATGGRGKGLQRSAEEIEETWRGQVGERGLALGEFSRGGGGHGGCWGEAEGLGVRLRSWGGFKEEVRAAGGREVLRDGLGRGFYSRPRRGDNHDCRGALRRIMELAVSWSWMFTAST